MSGVPKSTGIMRILIFGNSGSGKSRLARRLAGRNGLPVLDLDTIVWSQSATFRPDHEILADLERFLQANTSWIIEGCYGGWIERMLPHATEIVFMNPGEATCLSNCLARPWEAHKYSSKAEQDAHLAFLLDWVRGYYARPGDMSLREHRRLFDAHAGKKREITANEPDA